ncbi:hypothetical protein CANCADRAFT_2960 [Tortispora caseinolytica NRRL Y-17796]|uniref:Uncharacterized protein n=1 Tax=Tortispora caseinolytica NRRL Y-17796 TaxID=767744 RepID=A0A1E4THR1_9ASCO|nr:hypothetical protein CANCADRAFT_2960 [Tortispora caseinolytica NRRL Y-17796]
MLTQAQELKLIDYLDEQLKLVSRDYIRRFESPVEFVAICSKLTTIIELIMNDNTPTYIQSQYLIRILGDFIEYTEGFFPVKDDPSFLFDFCSLLDYSISSLAPSLSATDKVRLSNLAQSLRVAVVHFMTNSNLSGYEQEQSKVLENSLSILG